MSTEVLPAHRRCRACCSRRGIFQQAPSSTRWSSCCRSTSWRNPVMFVVYVGSILTTILVRPGARRAGRSAGRVHPRRHASGSWFTVLFANFAGRRSPKGAAKAQAAALRAAKRDVIGQELAEARRDAAYR